MKLVVITPVGPGHEKIVARAAASVHNAASNNAPWFTHVSHEIIPDHQGKIGRSAARNLAMRKNKDADWFFFLDADDIMRPDALHFCRFDKVATFGAVFLRAGFTADNVHPVTWETIGKLGARGTLSMGFFLKASTDIEFDESLDAGEDFDFYMRLPSFEKVKPPLVDIGRDTPSAGGPRGYERLDWIAVCDRVVKKYARENPVKFGIKETA
jgi:glycosyltransferase involved in cell wall biosynthesis